MGPTSILRRFGLTGEVDLDQELIEHQAIRSVVIATERDSGLGLRDRTIDDETLRRIQHELHLEPERMEA